METLKDDLKHAYIEDQQIEISSGKEQEQDDKSKANVDDSGQILDTQRRAIAERQLVRRLDMRLLPTIFLIYIVNYIDVRLNPFLSLR